MEVKKGAKEGKFIEFIYKECAENSILNEISNFNSRDELRAYKEEFLVKYFGFSDNMNFSESINEYLDKYIEIKNEELKDMKIESKYLEQFINMLEFVEGKKLIKDISSNRKNRLLAIFIGTTLALKESPDLLSKEVKIDLYSDNFIENSKSNGFNKLKENCDLVKKIILEANNG